MFKRAAEFKLDHAKTHPVSLALRVNGHRIGTDRYYLPIIRCLLNDRQLINILGY